MLRLGAGGGASLDQSLAFSGSIRPFAASDPTSTSSITVTAGAAVLAAVTVFTAPAVGPFVERHVFAQLSELPSSTLFADAEPTGAQRDVQLALSRPSPQADIASRFQSDGSPMATGSVPVRTQAQRQAADVIEKMSPDQRAVSGGFGLRGSLAPADPD